MQNTNFNNNNNDAANKNLTNGKRNKKRGKKEKDSSITKNNNNNNNNNNIVGTHYAEEDNTKTDPRDKKYEDCICICNRNRSVFECSRCHLFFYGRVHLICQKHPLDSFLMDFRNCPHCFETTANSTVSELSWETVQKMENATLPDDDDDL